VGGSVVVVGGSVVVVVGGSVVVVVSGGHVVVVVSPLPLLPLPLLPLPLLPLPLLPLPLLPLPLPRPRPRPRPRPCADTPQAATRQRATKNTMEMRFMVLVGSCCRGLGFNDWTESHYSAVQEQVTVFKSRRAFRMEWPRHEAGTPGLKSRGGEVTKSHKRRAVTKREHRAMCRTRSRGGCNACDAGRRRLCRFMGRSRGRMGSRPRLRA
jgi:hypothetical protein